jgi:hypothetical protein
MTYLYLLSLLTLVAYIVYALKVCVLPSSLSDTYYILKEKHRPSWLFQLAMVLCPMLLVPVCLSLSSASVQFLSFLACGGLMFVGTAPLFKEEFQRKVHFGGTIVAGLGTTLWLLFSGMWYIPSTFFFVSGIVMLFKKKCLFWLEMALFASAYSGLLVKMMFG